MCRALGVKGVWGVWAAQLRASNCSASGLYGLRLWGGGSSGFRIETAA